MKWRLSLFKIYHQAAFWQPSARFRDFIWSLNNSPLQGARILSRFSKSGGCLVLSGKPFKNEVARGLPNTIPHADNFLGKPGATIIPIILSSDKTQLTMFGNKTAYPVYMTIGNLPNEIHHKPSRSAYVLLRYLPTSRYENMKNKECISRVHGPCCSSAKRYWRCRNLDDNA